MHPSHSGKIGFLLFPLILILLISLPAFSAPLTMDYALGFNGLFQLKKWTPITVLLENKGPDIQACLEVVVTSGSEFWRDVHTVVYSMDVELPGNSKKWCTLNVLITSFTHPLIIRLRGDNAILISETLNLRHSFTEKQMVLMLGEKVSPEWLTLIPAEFQTVAVKPAFLPENAYGYEGVGLVILPVKVLKQLSEKQFKALHAWLEQGGFLLTSGDLQYGIFNEETVQSLLGLRVSGFKFFTSLSGLKAFCGRDLKNPEPFPVLKTEMSNAVRLLTEKGVPLIWQKDAGMGRILFLTFDFQNAPFTTWSGRELFWRKIMALKPASRPPAPSLDRQILQNTMINAMPMQFPSAWWALLLLGVYLSFFQIILRLAGKKRIQPLPAFGAGLLLFIIFGILTWMAFMHNRRQALSVNHFQHLQKNGHETHAVCHALTGVYSTKAVTYEFSYGWDGHPLFPILPTRLDEKTLQDTNLHKTKKEQIVRMQSGKWSYRFLAMETVVPAPVSGKASLEGKDLVVEISNQTSQVIKHACFYFASRLFALEDIGPGETLSRRFTEEEISRVEMLSDHLAEDIGEEWMLKAPDRFTGSMERVVTGELLAAAQSRIAAPRRVFYFFGFIQEAFLPLTYEKPALHGRGITLLEWTLPIQGT